MKTIIYTATFMGTPTNLGMFKFSGIKHASKISHPTQRKMKVTWICETEVKPTELFSEEIMKDWSVKFVALSETNK